MPVIRRGEADDLAAVAALQASSPEAAHWPVHEYLGYEFLVAVENGQVAGFVVWRRVAAGECELLNLVVASGARRQGLGRSLLEPLLRQTGGAVFLEVRESNQAALDFYKSMNFKEVNLRKSYYDFPPEAAIVMVFHSC
jgi:ribosomal-protein-alanine acetyltransferase